MLSDLWLPFPGGAERLMFNLARDLCRRGHDVLALTGYEYPLAYDGPRIVRADISLDADGWALIASTIAEHQPDVILTHHLYADLFAPELAATGIPIVRLHYHGPRPEGAALVVHISEHVAREAGAMGYDLVIPPPVFDDVVADTHGDAIGFVKPLPHKGAELVWSVAKRMPGRRFVVLRGEWQTLETIPRRLPRNVELLEPVVHMADFWRRVRLVLMPSLSEDAGTVAQEATANGLPCISSSVGGLSQTNAGGIQLEPGVQHARAWCSAIRYLDDPAHYRDVVRSQREHLPDWPALLDEFAVRLEAL